MEYNWSLVMIISMITLCMMHGMTMGHECKILAESGNKPVMDCSHLGLKTIPTDLPVTVTGLHLSWNSIKQLRKSDFCRYPSIERLDISYSNVHNIEQGTFDCLRKLTTLDVTLNNLTVNPEIFKLELFQFNPNLHTLLLAGQYVERLPESYPIDTILSIKNLERLSLSLYGEIPIGIEKHPTLKVLEFQWGYLDGPLSRQRMQAFVDSQIEELRFHNTSIKIIEEGAFTNMSKLRLLNLACNPELNPSDVIDAMSSSPNHSIDSLILDGTHMGQESIWSLGLKDAKTCRSAWESIRRLSLRGVDFTFFIANVTRCWSKLESLAIGHNDPVFHSRWDRFKVLFYLPHSLRALDVSRIMSYNLYNEYKNFHCSLKNGVNPNKNNEYFPPVDKTIKCDHSRHNGTKMNTGDYFSHGCSILPSTPKCLQYLDVSHLGLNRYGPPLTCVKSKLTSMRFINCSSCQNCFNRLEGPLFGLVELEILDISNMELLGVKTSIFREMPNLRVLLIENNHLGHDGLDPFPVHSKLQKIVLENNQLRNFTENTFQNLTNLAILSLAINQLDSVDFISSNLNLTLLDLSSNKLTTITKTGCDTLESIARKNANFQLDISNNPFQCGCEQMEFIRWFQSTKIGIISKANISCFVGTSLSRIASVDTEQMERSCNNIYLIVSLTSVIFLISIISPIVCYKKRWSIKWAYYKLKRRLKIRMASNDTDTERMFYNAYIIYPFEDEFSRRWVCGTLLNQVEGEWQLRVHINGRDDRPGEYYITNMVNGLMNSRCAIWCVNPAFFEDDMCVKTAQYALCHFGPTKNFIVSFQDNRITPSNVPRTFAQLLNPKVKLRRAKFTEQEDGLQLFWKKLQDFIVGDTEDTIEPSSLEPLLIDESH